MRRAAAAALLFAFALAGAACTSVPVSTMWKFARFDRAELLAVDPAQLRAAALIDPRATMKDVTMKVTLIPKDGKETAYTVMLAAPVSRDARLPAAPPGRRWEIFALTPDGQRDFLRMREAAVSLPSGSSLALTLSAREGMVPPDLIRRFPLRLDLMLDTSEGWFTVLKDSEVDLTPMVGKG
jgi:hypothetical protein